MRYPDVMVMRLSVAARNAMLTGPGLARLLDAGSGPGTVKIYTGTQPATAATAASGTLLATLTLSDPAFADAANGVSAVQPVTEDSSADASGTAGWFRAADSTGATCWDGSVGATGSGADMTLANPALIQGGVVDIDTWQVSQPTS